MPVYVITETTKILVEAEVSADNAEKAVLAYKQNKRNRNPLVSISKAVEDAHTIAELKEEEN